MKVKQKSTTALTYVSTFDKFEEYAMRLFRTYWPLDPCRKTSVTLSNLRDEHGNVAETTHFTSKRTGGLACLGAGWKERNFETEYMQAPVSALCSRPPMNNTFNQKALCKPPEPKKKVEPANEPKKGSAENPISL